MSDAQLLNTWYLALGIAGLIVVIAAALLLAILAVARDIERGARTALTVVEQVRANTQVIWALEDTNKVATELLGGARSILDHAGQIAMALHEADMRAGRARS